MVDIWCDKLNYHKVSKYANILIFKEFYLKTKNVSYYLKAVKLTHSTKMPVSGSMQSNLLITMRGPRSSSSKWHVNSLTDTTQRHRYALDFSSIAMEKPGLRPSRVHRPSIVIPKKKSRCVCEKLCGNKVQKAIFSFKVKVKVTRSLTLVSFERASLVEYACQIWSLYLLLLQFKSYSKG